MTNEGIGKLEDSAKQQIEDDFSLWILLEESKERTEKLSIALKLVSKPEVKEALSLLNELGILAIMPRFGIKNTVGPLMEFQQRPESHIHD